MTKLFRSDAFLNLFPHSYSSSDAVCITCCHRCAYTIIYSICWDPFDHLLHLDAACQALMPSLHTWRRPDGRCSVGSNHSLSSRDDSAVRAGIQCGYGPFQSGFIPLLVESLNTASLLHPSEMQRLQPPSKTTSSKSQSVKLRLGAPSLSQRFENLCTL